MFERIAGPLTLYSTTVAGAPRVYRLAARPGGDAVKSINVQIRVLQASTPGNVKISAKLEHGPDGTVSVAHSTPINAFTFSSTPILATGSSGTGMFLPHLHPVVEIDRVSGTGAEEWVVVEIYEVRKPY